MNAFTEIKVGQEIIVDGKFLVVTETPNILHSFFASDSDGEELEFHTSQIDAVLPLAFWS